MSDISSVRSLSEASCFRMMQTYSIVHRTLESPKAARKTSLSCDRINFDKMALKMNLDECRVLVEVENSFVLLEAARASRCVRNCSNNKRENDNVCKLEEICVPARARSAGTTEGRVRTLCSQSSQSHLSDPDPVPGIA